MYTVWVPAAVGAISLEEQARALNPQAMAAAPLLLPNFLLLSVNEVASPYDRERL